MVDCVGGEWMYVSCLQFDDETVSAQPLHRGDKESCERVADLIPAVSYSGDKTVTKSWMSIVRYSDYVNAMRDLPELGRPAEPRPNDKVRSTDQHDT